VRKTTVVCDRCEAVAEPSDFWWQLAFTREVVVDDDMTEFISETWDLCLDCYEIVVPNVIYAVQPLEEGV
jgi:hypothetical protein